MYPNVSSQFHVLPTYHGLYTSSGQISTFFQSCLGAVSLPGLHRCGRPHPLATQKLSETALGLCRAAAEGKWRLQDEGLAKLFDKLVELVGRNMDVPWGKLTSSNSDAENTCFPQENNLQMKCLHG
jgi:hypothetical protein